MCLSGFFGLSSPTPAIITREIFLSLANTLTNLFLLPSKFASLIAFVIIPPCSLSSLFKMLVNSLFSDTKNTKFLPVLSKFEKLIFIYQI
jgi:hypothetical protein